MLLKFKEHYPEVHPTAWIAHSADVIGDVKIGENSSVWFQCVIRSDVNKVRIGKNTNIQDLSMIHTDVDSQTIIGDNVTVGHKVMLHGCTIEDNCLIGMSATILDHAVISEGSIVGANSLVTSGKKFPPRSLIMGSPAKVVKELTQEDVEKLIKHAAHYVDYKNDYC
ncbi:gamma carbonic anhydrase family protein [Halarcobacter bivalviorum]|uniref:gamma carbonic anhydrase family protein n=1 Tax=Halarcobacter bivalviorum TaxID=663364 RepID=UPI00100A28A5|nr:gamma carbonic anhydrase family protein [Halarcobacter bivalviorum]RXK06178.1 gamma carbonic anhydrase family protein [Halarcobacter bivalviorum]